MADVRIRWHLETIGDPSRGILAQDRKIRSSITQTDRLQRKLATASTQTGRAQERASKTTARALQGEGRAARSTASDVTRLNRAQADALRAGAGIANRARSTADAYRQQARAARELTGAERARARIRGAGAGVAGAAAATGAAVGLAGAAGGAAAVKGVTIFAGFEQQMDRVQAVSGATGKQMAAMSKQAENLGAKTSFSAREAADGMYQLSTAGFKTREVMRTIPGVLDLAAASGVGIAEAAELQAAAVRGFGLRARDAGHVADVLAKSVNVSAIEMSDLAQTLPYVASTARQTGTSFEQVAAAASILGNAGIKGSQAGTALRTSMLRLTDPSKKMLGVFASMGIESRELAAMPLPKVIGRVAEGLKKLPTRGEKVGAISAIFGKEAAPAMLNLMAKGRGGIDRITDALVKSDGVAKQTAKTMRNNVAGGWDEFTGSLETAAITLTKRFGPALKDALKGAAGFTNKAARGGSDFIAGLTGAQRERKITRGPGGRVESVAVAPDTGSRSAGMDVRGFGLDVAAKAGPILKTIATAAQDAGRMLLEAFKPALPFFENVLLPLLKGIGIGVLGSVVGAFKVLTGVIRIVATGLGWLGEKAKPLRGVFQAVGVVIGWVFSGPILKGISLVGKLGGVLGKLGIVFKIVGVAARVLAAPVRIAGALFGGLLRVGASLVTRLAGPARAAFGIVGRAAGSVAGVIRGAIGKITGAAAGIVRGIKRVLAPIAVNMYSAFRGGIDRVFSVVKGAGGTLFRLGKGLVSRLVDGLKGIGGAIKSAFGSGVGFAADIGRALADWLNRSTPLGDKVNLPSPLPDFTLPTLRRGGHVRRYQGGGTVPILAAGGELMVDGSGAGVIPGDPRSDSTLIFARPGARVFTADGQARLAAGMGPDAALATQAPHFAGGGRVTPGRYLSTAYGPPWNAMNGTGVTATGVNLKPARHAYGVAVDPSRIGLGSKVYAWPNPFGYNGAFSAFDTGGAIKGNRLDFYDWRGRAAQNRWGRRNVEVHSRSFRRQSAANTFTSGGGSAAPKVSILGPSRRRSGAVPDAWTQGYAFGLEGGTRGAIRREGNPIIAALREQAGQAGPTGGSLSQRYRRESGAGGGRVDDRVRRLRSIAANTRRPYVFGGGHGGFSRSPGGLDCSGYTSHVLHFGGANPDLASPVTTTGTARYGRAGRGKRVTLHTRNGGAGGGHVMLTIDGHGYSSGNRATGRLSGRNDVSSSYLSTLPIKRHPVGMRRGGTVPPNMEQRSGNVRSFAPGAGGALNRGARKALTLAGGSMDALDRLLGEATLTRIQALREAIQRRIRAGGPANVVKRLQGMLSTIDFEVGRRVGRIVERVSKRSDSVGRAQTRLDLRQRRAGIDPASSRGLAGAIAFAEDRVIPAAQRNVSDLKTAIARARRRGDRGTVRELSTQLLDAQGTLDEAVTSQIERQRDLVRTAAQEATDVAGHRSNLASSGLRRLELEQRLAGTFEGGGQQRADFIRQQIIPGLQGEVDALRAQLGVASAQGDTALARQIAEAIDAKQGDVLQAQLDAQETIADNTAELKEFSGSLAMEFAGGSTTDRLSDFGLGT